MNTTSVKAIRVARCFEADAERVFAGVLPAWADRTKQGWTGILDHLADTL